MDERDGRGIAASIAQAMLKQVPEKYNGKTLSETGINAAHNILVLPVDRDRAVPATAGNVFQPGDKLTVFGNDRTICDAFETQDRFTLD